MRFMRAAVPGLIGVLAVGTALLAADGGEGRHEEFPPGFDFPANDATLNRFIKTQNVGELRRHAWYIWAGLTHESRSGGPIWETWYPREEVLKSDGKLRSFASRRLLEAPRQHPPVGGSRSSIGQSLLASVLFNGPGSRHVRENKYHQIETYDKLLERFNREHTPIRERTIRPFPRDTIVLLASWWLVKQKGLTALPVWDFGPARPIAWGRGAEDASKRLLGNYPYSWKRFVAVDPSGASSPPGRTADVVFEYVDQADQKTKRVPKPGCRVVPIGDFYAVRLETLEEVQAAGDALGGSVQAGDFAVLVGMHVATKETGPWTYSTHWWHDRPADGPYARDRIDDVTGVWRHYLMSVIYDFERPREFDGSPASAFNPYIEAAFASGTTSNCMACHQRAAYPQHPTYEGTPIFLPVTRGRLDEDDPFFADKVRLDYVWPLYLPGYAGQPKAKP